MNLTKAQIDRNRPEIDPTKAQIDLTTAQMDQKTSNDGISRVREDFIVSGISF